MQSLSKDLIKKTQESIELDRRNAAIELKKELYKKRSDFELEIKKTRIELQRLEQKNQKKEDALDQREGLLDELRKELQQKERDLTRRLDIVSNNEQKVKKLYEELVAKLEKVSGMKEDEAKDFSSAHRADLKFLQLAA